MARASHVNQKIDLQDGDAVVPCIGAAKLSQAESDHGVDAHHPMPHLWRCCPITLGRGAARGETCAPSMLDAGVTR